MARVSAERIRRAVRARTAPPPQALEELTARVASLEEEIRECRRQNLRLAELTPGERIAGPAFVESPVTTVVVEPGGSVELAPSGSLLLRPTEEAP